MSALWSSCPSCSVPLVRDANRAMVCRTGRCALNGLTAIEPCAVCRRRSVRRGAHGAWWCEAAECPAWRRVWTTCPVCQRASVLEVTGGAHACLARDCPTSTGQVHRCAYCLQDGFMSKPGTSFCVPGNAGCGEALRRKHPCRHCGRYTLDEGRRRCDSPACPTNRAPEEPRRPSIPGASWAPHPAAWPPAPAGPWPAPPQPAAPTWSPAQPTWPAAGPAQSAWPAPGPTHPAWTQPGPTKPTWPQQDPAHGRPTAPPARQTAETAWQPVGAGPEIPPLVDPEPTPAPSPKPRPKRPAEDEVVVLTDVDQDEAPCDETFVLFGAQGAGRSTFLEVLGELVPDDPGATAPSLDGGAPVRDLSADEADEERAAARYLRRGLWPLRRALDDLQVLLATLEAPVDRGSPPRRRRVRIVDAPEQTWSSLSRPARRPAEGGDGGRARLARLLGGATALVVFVPADDVGALATPTFRAVLQTVVSGLGPRAQAALAAEVEAARLPGAHGRLLLVPHVRRLAQSVLDALATADRSFDPQEWLKSSEGLRGLVPAPPGVAPLELARRRATAVVERRDVALFLAGAVSSDRQPPPVDDARVARAALESLGCGGDDLALSSAPPRPALELTRLRAVHVVVTRTDLALPPTSVEAIFHDDLDQGLLRRARAGLRLLGGDVRLFPASATGYVHAHGPRLAPPPWSAAAPVNVLEPFARALGPA